MLFIRGKAMSGAPIISGTNQLPKPPIMAGMTMKKIMIRAWAGDDDVVAVLGRLDEAQLLDQAEPSVKTWMPGSASSQRIRPDRAPPTRPAMMANSM